MSRKASKQADKQEGKQLSTRKAFSRSHALEGLVKVYNVLHPLTGCALRLMFTMTQQ